MNEFWKSYFRRLLILILGPALIILVYAFFYPDLIPFFGTMVQFLGALGLGPAFIIFFVGILLISAIPKNRL